MQKKILMTAMVAGMSFMLFACGNDADTETTVQTTAEETTVASVATTQEVTTVEETTKKKKKKKKEETTQETTTVQETTQAPTTVAPTTKKVEKATEKKTKKTEKTTKKSEKATKKSEKTTKSGSSSKATAKKYVGKSIDSLVAAVGKYKTSEKAPSCLYEGENDGIFYWKDFTVSAHTKNGKWIIDSVN